MILYAIIVGLKTSAPIMQDYSRVLCFTESVLVILFSLEIIMRMLAIGTKFFKSGWNIFDLLVMSASAISESAGIASIRVFRLIRLSEVLALSKHFRMIAASLIRALPGILHVAVLLLFLFYLSSIVAFELFSKTNPDLFGSFSQCIYTLFLMMLGDNIGEVLPRVMAVHKHSYVFFVLFLTVMTFTMLNLFFGLIVDAIQAVASGRDNKEDDNQLKSDGLNDQFNKISKRLDKIETMLSNRNE
jgi:voltage-gated sodium channel